MESAIIAHIPTIFHRLFLHSQLPQSKVMMHSVHLFQRIVRTTSMHLIQGAYLVLTHTMKETKVGTLIWHLPQSGQRARPMLTRVQQMHLNPNIVPQRRTLLLLKKKKPMAKLTPQT